jgi:hypothetical protein
MDSVEACEIHADEFLRRRDESLVGSRVNQKLPDIAADPAGEFLAWFLEQMDRAK